MPTQTFITFDADDTLWPNQPHFDHVEAQLIQILAPYADTATINARLYDVQRANMQLFGYGAKSFMLSMIETTIQHTGGAVVGAEIQRILDIGQGFAALRHRAATRCGGRTDGAEAAATNSSSSPKATCSTRKARLRAPAWAIFLTTSRL